MWCFAHCKKGPCPQVTYSLLLALGKTREGGEEDRSKSKWESFLVLVTEVFDIK